MKPEINIFKNQNEEECLKGNFLKNLENYDTGASREIKGGVVGIFYRKELLRSIRIGENKCCFPKFHHYLI